MGRRTPTVSWIGVLAEETKMKMFISLGNLLPPLCLSVDMERGVVLLLLLPLSRNNFIISRDRSRENESRYPPFPPASVSLNSPPPRQRQDNEILKFCLSISLPTCACVMVGHGCFVSLTSWNQGRCPTNTCTESSTIDTRACVCGDIRDRRQCGNAELGRERTYAPTENPPHPHPDWSLPIEYSCECSAEGEVSTGYQLINLETTVPDSDLDLPDSAPLLPLVRKDRTNL
eukprot:sb/3469432/